MDTMGNSKLKGIADEVIKSLDMNEFKKVVEPLVKQDKDTTKGINFMEILSNPQVMGLV